jgi:hypothetical protein
LQIEFKLLPLTRSTVSGGIDPRTSSTVFLFEEFVPDEYRQQLSAGVQTKERWLPSFHLARQSNGNKLRLSMDAPTLSAMFLGV